MLAPDAGAQLRRHVASLQVERRLPSVSAAVFRRGEVVWEGAVGRADLDRDTAATPDTQYRLGSITKTFTAVAVLQLRDAGALSIDEPLAAYVAELRDDRATARAVLSHESGLQRELPGATFRPISSPSRDELLSRLGEVERVLEPGDGWHYSNLAFALLGEVVARVSGMPYERYVEQRIFAPLGLTRTTWQAVEPAATGYYVEPWSDVFHVEPPEDMGGGVAAGQLWGTTGDLARWAGFLRRPDPAVLSPATAEEMHRLRAIADVAGWRLGWGLGLMLYRTGERVFAGHSGGMNGFLANVAWETHGDLGAAVLVNAHSNFSIDTVGTELLERALDVVPAEPDAWRPAEPLPAELEGVLGNWWTEGWEFVLTFRGDRLEARNAAAPPSAPPAVFVREGEDRWRTVSGRERGELLEIRRDQSGAPVELSWAGYPLTRVPLPYG